jgi:hypothetical protein
MLKEDQSGSVIQWPVPDWLDVEAGDDCWSPVKFSQLAPTLVLLDLGHIRIFVVFCSQKRIQSTVPP